METMKIQIGRHTKNPSRLEDARVFRTAARSLQNSKNIHFCVDFRTAPRGPGKPRVFKTPGISGLQAAVVRLIGRTFWPTQGQDRSTRYQEPPRLEDTGVFGSAARSLQNHIEEAFARRRLACDAQTPSGSAWPDTV
jgi:hypothetical protein